jgi:hypothetical protein
VFQSISWRMLTLLLLDIVGICIRITQSVQAKPMPKPSSTSKERTSVRIFFGLHYMMFLLAQQFQRWGSTTEAVKRFFFTGHGKKLRNESEMFFLYCCLEVPTVDAEVDVENSDRVTKLHIFRDFYLSRASIKHLLLEVNAHQTTASKKSRKEARTIAILM